MQHNEMTGAVVDTAMDIHRRLGPGLFASVYRKVLAYELRKRGLDILEERPIPVVWEDVKLEVGFQADLVVAGITHQSQETRKTPRSPRLCVSFR